MSSHSDITTVNGDGWFDKLSSNIVLRAEFVVVCFRTFIMFARWLKKKGYLDYKDQKVEMLMGSCCLLELFEG